MFVHLSYTLMVLYKYKWNLTLLCNHHTFIGSGNLKKVTMVCAYA